LRAALSLVGFVAALAAGGALATDVNVIGLFPGKAVVTINRGAPRTLSVGETTSDGVKLVAVDSRGAVIEVDGKRESLEMGQHFESASQTGARQSATLAADSRGHFVADGQVNGTHMRFLVDTGATLVAIPAADAVRLGIDYRKGRQGMSQTANGPAVVYRVMLDSVTVGDVTLLNVEGIVHDSAGLDVALLGMSFLNRTEMRREGANLMLIKRY
jgi:aspartyl protease family protein